MPKTTTPSAPRQRPRTPGADAVRSDARAAGKPFHHGDLPRALLDAALAAPELEGLSLRQLAAEVGVSAAAVYRHFESREALLTELARIGFDRLERCFAAAFDMRRAPSGPAEARARLVGLGAAYLRFADSEPALWRLMFGVQSASYRSAAAPSDRLHSYEYLPAALHGLFSAGVIPRAPAPSDAFFAWSAIHGAATLRAGRITPAQGPLEVLAADMAERIVRSLAVAPAA